MENIYRATELVGEAYGKFIGDASPEVRTWLVHKLKHTFGVAHDIMDIFQNEKTIYEHNRREINYKNPLYVALPDKEKQQAAIMAKLLRDADKLENIKCFAYYGIDRLGKAPDGVLSEPIKQDLLNKQTVDYSNIKTATDGLAMILSWNNDIYYATTVKRLKEIDFINLGIEAVSQHGSSNEDLELLRENIFYHTVGD